MALCGDFQKRKKGMIFLQIGPQSDAVSDGLKSEAITVVNGSISMAPAKMIAAGVHLLLRYGLTYTAATPDSHRLAAPKRGQLRITEGERAGRWQRNLATC
jgi:hypothetical protein